ncbi:MAG: hypothetical protein KBF75_03260 [Saprospiraceae bacterium]|jgi:magnesium-transporting ATPase (P-type)|nr:hypothetical protein [Saprospiraceae bacterium]
MIRFILKYIMYCLLFGVLVSICSFIFYWFTANDVHKNERMLENSLIYGCFMIIMGGELIVFALLGYAYLIRISKPVFSLGILKNTILYIVIICLILLAFMKFHFMKDYKYLIDWIRGIHLKGWIDVVTIIIGIILYYCELRPIFVKKCKIGLSE